MKKQIGYSLPSPSSGVDGIFHSGRGCFVIRNLPQRRSCYMGWSCIETHTVYLGSWTLSVKFACQVVNMEFEGGLYRCFLYGGFHRGDLPTQDYHLRQ